MTEALAFGVPMVVMPFSTDQFAGAEALERVGFGVALAPNDASAPDIAQALHAALNLPKETRQALKNLSANLRQKNAREQILAARPRPPK